MPNFYDKLGDLLKDRLESDADPFDTWEPRAGKRRSAGNEQERMAPPRSAPDPRRVRVPDELLGDFMALGLQPGVSADTCKAAWKRLLKRNHPDRFANEPERAQEATKRVVKLTDSWRRIERWFETGKAD